MPFLVALVGPTAVGKTAAALTLAQRYNGEIVSADSRQIYRGMDIGTAKPTTAERASAPHHLLDLVAPDQPFSLADYLTLARAAIATIQAAGRLPLLVGGTAQYVSAVLEGWQPPPVPPQSERRERLTTLGASELYRRLQTIDPLAAEQIGPHNLRRLVRALEVWEVTGQPPSTWQQRQPPAYRILRLGLQLTRPALHARIEARIDAMLAAGLVEEVRGLLEAGYPPTAPALQSIGYAETIAALQGAIDLAEARRQMIVNTNRFVRHQETWWRRDRQISWVDAADPTQAPARLSALVDQALVDHRDPTPG